MYSFKHSNHIFAITALVLLTILLALPTIHYGYLLEDYKYLRSYSPEEILMTFHSHWEPLGGETKGYRPLHSVQFALFYVLIGGNPVTNHLLHIILLITGVLLLYAFFLRCIADRSAAFWSALVYPCLGTMAWQISWLVNRQHLFQVILLAILLISYDRYLGQRKKIFWFASFLIFIAALLLKETAVTYPFLLLSFALIIRKKSLRSQWGPLLPFFILLGVFIIIRAQIVKEAPEFNIFPPPLPLNPLVLIREYLHGLGGALIQSHGIYDLKNDFPIYGLGFATTRDFLGIISLSVFALSGAILLIRGRSEEKKRAFLFGLIILLFANVIVAAWYRTNRMFISSIGITLMAGTLISGAFPNLQVFSKGNKGRTLLRTATILGFMIYLAVNLATFLEIQWALRPDGFLALTWDRWDYDEYFEWREKKGIECISGDQMKIFKEKLRRTGRDEWADKLSERITNPGGKQ